MFKTTLSKMQRCIIILLALVICLPLTACRKEPPATEIHTSKVIRSGSTCFFEYGNFLYFSYDGIYRYNTVTGELSSACLDPECEGECPLHGGMSRIGALEDGKIYFYAFKAFTHDIYLGYQDLISGEVTVLDTLSENEYSKDFTFVNGGYFYYYAGILKDGGDSKKPEDYETHLCRIPTAGGEREVIDGPQGYPQMIIDGKLLMQSSGLSLYDLETGIEKVIWNYGEHGYKGVRDFSYVDGKVYCLGIIESENAEVVVNKYTGITYLKNMFIISIDITTGEWKKVADEAVESFNVTNDRIYYFPSELRYLYVPENYEKNPDDIFHCFFSPTLYSRKIDGSDKRAEYTNEAINTCYDYTVIDGKFYGNIGFYDESLRRGARSELCTIDLETGEIIDKEKVRK